jgi:hypothetical protein
MAEVRNRLRTPDLPHVKNDELEGFYDLIVDRQFWFNEHHQLISRIDKNRHAILYEIFFHPAILAQLSIIDSSIMPEYRRETLLRLLYIFHAIVAMRCFDSATILLGFPPMSRSPPRVERPRKRLPINVPPPPLKRIPDTAIGTINVEINRRQFHYYLLIGPHVS